jgi:3,4-dihydroxyphenylacetate 2,3-dioxygenase
MGEIVGSALVAHVPPLVLPERLIKWMEAGDHAAVLADYPDFRQYAPEGRFAHYVIMATALGGPAWNSPGVPYSDYENAAGTGQIHLWFPTV